MRVTIGEETREVTAREFVSACNRSGTAIKLDLFRPVCDHEQARAILDASAELEAALLIEMAAGYAEIRDALKERMAILWVEGLSHSSMDATRAMIGR